MQAVGVTKRSSDVPEQFYGYAIQLPRMVVHLLDAEIGGSVCLEHIDDVATLGPDSEIELEQSKSAFSANPVSDRALPFWKTLSNWVDVVKAGRVAPETTRFRIHVAQTRECGPLVARLRDATSDAEVQAAIEAGRTEFWGAAPQFSLRSQVPVTLNKYIENVFSAPSDVLPAIVKRLGIDVGSGDSLSDVRVRTRKQLVSADQVDGLVLHVLGWLQQKVLATIEAQDVVIIPREEFFAAMLAYVRKYDRILQLSPWATEPTTEAIDTELQTKIYVRQLELIEADVDDKIAAAANYLKSIADRTAWSARGHIEPSSFKEFESHLQEQWKARLKAVSIEHSDKPDIARGQLLYARCQQYQAKLQSMDPSPYFTLGCFHSLSDELAVGWHPSFRDLLSPTAGKKAS